MAGYFDYLCAVLEPLRIYSTSRGSISASELYAAGEELDSTAEALNHAEQEGILQLAENEGLARREKLFARCPVSVSTQLRREAIAALERINSDSFTLAAINKTISGCGLYAVAEETNSYGKVRVQFPNTIGEPENFSQIEEIILGIMPCHLLTEFYFRLITWAECEAQSFTWADIEADEHTWRSFEKVVPTA